ncbi:MAG: ATP-binding cassette domain-containing protein [Rudaea sp.]|nr:ATP-binding cassette domain-containing protein [Rudaea sp.]
MVHLESISRCYGLTGRPVQALRDIGVFISAEQFVSIVGPSGSGKSTLLNILGCLDRPAGGTYWLDGALDIAAHAQPRIDVRDGKIESDHAA